MFLDRYTVHILTFPPRQTDGWCTPLTRYITRASPRCRASNLKISGTERMRKNNYSLQEYSVCSLLASKRLSQSDLDLSSRTCGKSRGTVFCLNVFTRKKVVEISEMRQKRPLKRP